MLNMAARTSVRASEASEPPERSGIEGAPRATA